MSSSADDVGVMRRTGDARIHVVSTFSKEAV
jgi:hypothetical protein